MRIPFPERVPLNRVALFVVALFVIQWLEGTALYFCFGCAVFILISAVAFNVGGGLTRSSGAYVFCYSMMVVIIGVCYKAFLGEPGQSNLQDPVTDMEVYVVGIIAMLAAVIVSRRFSRKSGLLQHILKESEMYRSSVGCIVVGIGAVFAIALLGQSGAQLQSTFAQLNELIPLGIIIGVMYEIRRSGGSRSVNIPIVVGGLYSFFLGMTGFSKQGMLTPLLCWFLPVTALRYRLSAWQMIGGLTCVFLIFHYLVPFAQYGRGQVPQDSTLEQRIAIAIPLLEHPEQTRQLYAVEMDAQTEGVVRWSGYYNEPQGFWDRLEFLNIDDSLVSFTQQGDRTVGLGPIIESFVNAVPRFFWPNKPAPRYGGNFYAHEMGTLSDDDTTTGISFSPTAEAFHIAKWIGVVVIAPLLWFLTFVIFDSLFGDLRATPWGLLVLAQLIHVAPEGALSALIHFITFGAEITIFCALFATWVAPVFATPVLGPDRRKNPPRFSFRAAFAPEPAAEEHT